MMKLLRRPFVLIVSSVLLGALWLPGIGSAQAPSARATASPGEAGTDQLVSDDGRLTLTMPLGVDAAGLSIVPVQVGASMIAAYELRPLDTTFPAPVSASWQLDQAGAPPATNGDLVWLAMARADDAAAGPWSWLDDPHVSIADGDYLLTGGLSRFGTLVVTLLTTLVHGPEAIWGPGYSPGRGVEVPLDLTLSERSGSTGAAAFSGGWRFGGGYPGSIEVTTTAAETDRLAAVWWCLRTGATSLTTTFGIRQDMPEPDPTDPLPGVGAAAAAFSVTFPVACGATHARPNG